MRSLEAVLVSELTWLMRTAVPTRGVRLTVYDMVLGHLDLEPLGPEEVGGAVQAAVRAACRVVREASAPEELVQVVCGAALAAVRGQGGESSRWLPDAERAARIALADLAVELTDERAWPWLAQGATPRWG